MRYWLAALIAIMLIAQPAAVGAEPTVPPWRQELPEGREAATIVVGTTEVKVDLAITPTEQTLGLGYRNGLEEGTGMLFVGDAPRTHTFWMKGMRFCLDIIWIEDGTIVGAAENVCPDSEGTSDGDRETFSSGVPVTHVLEMPAGWLVANGYGPGTQVDLSELQP